MKTTNPVRVVTELSPFNPTANDVYARFREPQQVICPEEKEYAAIQVDAEMAAATAALGLPWLRIIRCTEWPLDCGRGCLELLS